MMDLAMWVEAIQKDPGNRRGRALRARVLLEVVFFEK